MVPSQLYADLYWRATYDDIKCKVKLHIGEKQARIVQDFDTLGKILSMAFGSGEGEKKQEVKVPQSAAELRSVFNQMMFPKQ